MCMVSVKSYTITYQINIFSLVLNISDFLEGVDNIDLLDGVDLLVGIDLLDGVDLLVGIDLLVGVDLLDILLKDFFVVDGFLASSLDVDGGLVGKFIDDTDDSDVLSS